RLGSIVVGNTYRNPAVLLKQAVTVDHVSGGRVVLGLGAGWQENEHIAYGLDYPGTKGRLDRLDEACQVVQLLKRNERATFAGQHYRLVDAPLSPKPVGPLPLMVGGGGEKRTLRTTAQWADEWNVWSDPPLFTRKHAILRQHCDAIGRDAGEIVTSTNALLFLSTDEHWLAQFRDRDMGRPVIVGTPAEVAEIVAAYAAAGVDELILPDFTMPDPIRKREMFDLFITEVAPAFR
ncbi:MAG TPA: LLM class flavin-dependent oxidoreductase, partial [Acidimicrobiales bacterium]